MAFITGFGRKCALTIDHTKVGGDETDFPVLFTVSNLPSEMFDADGLHPAMNGGGDIRFSLDINGTNKIPCEIESFVTNNDPANGVAEIWVKISSLSSSADTIIYVWYNKPGEIQLEASDPYGSEAVWNSHYIAVWHMNQDPSTTDLLDSTINEITMTRGGGFLSTDLIDGKFGKAIQTDGGTTAGQSFKCADATILKPESLSLEMVNKVYGTVIASWGKWVHKGEGGFPYGSYMLQQSNDDPQYKVETQTGMLDPNNYNANYSVPAINQWNYVMGTYSSTDYYVRVHVNGSLRSSTLTNSSYAIKYTDSYGGTNGLGIYCQGGPTTANAPYGALEELRILDQAKTEAYGITENNMMLSVSTFSAAGNPQIGKIQKPIVVCFDHGIC